MEDRNLQEYEVLQGTGHKEAVVDIGRDFRRNQKEISEGYF